MQASKKVTKGGGVTIPRGIRQETGILPGVPVDITTNEDGIHIQKHVPACFHCGTVDDVKMVCGIEICRECAAKIAEVFEMMSDVMEIKAKADRLVELTSQQSVIKAEIDEIKAWFEKLATDDLRDTKKKTIDYWGSNNSKVVVGNSETVKPVSMTMVKKLLGDVFGDFVKEDTAYKMTEPCKRLFTMMFMGNYTEGSLDETIKAITADEKIQRTLKKKLKGKYEKDTETLMKLVGLPEQEASDWAYLTAEIINWEWMLQILKSAEWKGTPQEAVEIIRAAIIVDEGIKVTVEAEKTE